MDDAVTLPSRFNRLLAPVLGVGAAVLLWAAIADGTGGLLWAYPAAALLTFFAWAALWRPAVRVDDGGVTVRNVTHRVRIPWTALVLVDTRYALTLRTPGLTVVAWAAPAPGTITAARAGRLADNREKRVQAGAPLRPGDLIGTESGDAAVVVRERWQRLLAEGRVETGIADEVRVRREWDVPVIAGGAALVVATIATFLLAR